MDFQSHKQWSEALAVTVTAAVIGAVLAFGMRGCANYNLSRQDTIRRAVERGCVITRSDDIMCPAEAPAKKE